MSEREKTGLEFLGSGATGMRFDLGMREYYRDLAKVVWGSMSARERKRLRKKHLMVYLALEGLIRHGGLE